MSTVVYSSMWYNIENINDRETVAFLIQHTQRYVRFSAYGMYDLSMETFSGVSKIKVKNIITQTTIYMYVLLHP